MNIIQIGANRGNDDLTQIILDNKEIVSKVILVEPLPVHHLQLKECYKEVPVIIEAIAITPDPKTKKMSLYYSLKDAPYYEVASYSKDHLLKHGLKENDIIEAKVECMTKSS